MEQITINLSANNQNLTVDNVLEITDDAFNCVEFTAGHEQAYRNSRNSLYNKG